MCWLSGAAHPSLPHALVSKAHLSHLPSLPCLPFDSLAFRTGTFCCSSSSIPGCLFDCDGSSPLWPSWVWWCQLKILISPSLTQLLGSSYGPQALKATLSPPWEWWDLERLIFQSTPVRLDFFPLSGNGGTALEEGQGSLWIPSSESVHM